MLRAGGMLPAALLLLLTGIYVTGFRGGHMEVAGPSLAAGVPLAWGNWRGVDQQLTDEETKELLPQGVLYRLYSNTALPERPVAVLVLYWGSSAAKPHAPEICLASAGYTVFDEKQERFTAAGDSAAAGPGTGRESVVNVFRARRGMTERVIYYWWYTGKGGTADFGAFRKSTAMRGVFGQPSWGAFVRVEAAGLREEEPALDEQCREMSREMLRYLPAVFRFS